MSFVDYCFSVLRTQEFVQLNCYVTSTGTLSIFFSSIITVVSGTLGILLTLFINSNRTVWSPIRSVIIRVITSMITDRIGLHSVLLPVNQNYDKI